MWTLPILLYSDLSVPFSRHINVISGETSVGKTNIMKALYSYGKTINEINDLYDPVSNERVSEILTSKFLGVFRPDDRKIGRLVKRNRGRGNATCKITFDDGYAPTFSFSILATKTIKMEGYQQTDTWLRFVYIPAKRLSRPQRTFHHYMKSSTLLLKRRITI